jgi:hypothetical protein
MRLCQVCKAAIEPERIEAIPETRLCTEHGREIAKYGGEFVMSAEHERTSKQGSLKLNYGGITTSKRRNDQAIQELRNDYELGRAR